METSRLTRRRFLQQTAATAAALALSPRVYAADSPQPAPSRSKNDRFRIGAIGMRYQGTVITELALPYGDVVAISDVDREIAETARLKFGGQAELYEDYRDMLQRNDIDVVMIGAPDHWHTAMTIDACRAGKDVYCEKPLTLTVDEGKQLVKVVAETKRVVQVGSWHRSDWRFRLACEMVRAGRIGKLHRVTVALGKNPTGGPFQTQRPPKHLNWDLWQGQVLERPYAKERCHYTFRWWYEYAGGKMTDWGAHYIDIAHWGLGVEQSGPIEVHGRATLPEVENGYNVARDFQARLVYANGVELLVQDEGRNGVLFEGEHGRIFANRGTIAGKPVEDREAKPFGKEDYRLYPHDNLSRPDAAGKTEAIVNHMGNFFDCVVSRNMPLSDIASQHRTATACHLANISMRLGRPLRWNPDQEQIVDDQEASAWLKREQREGYAIHS